MLILSSPVLFNSSTPDLTSVELFAKTLLALEAMHRSSVRDRRHSPGPSCGADRTLKKKLHTYIYLNNIDNIESKSSSPLSNSKCSDLEH